ncbi:MAG: outer membrane beta-barrel protein, partial [Bacteroidia bacterium]|nr:outer membrane beta-barrel protein [Bacteroidia bacterium]
ISASYALTDKISVRTGLNLVNLGYSTNDVAVLSRTVSSGSLNQNLYKNIDFNNTSRSMTILNINQPFSEDLPSTLPNKIKGELDQELGYIEVPIEVEYKLMDNKFGMSFIGGFSTLFLNNNEIYAINNGEKTLIGEATNVNNTSFSANLGLGLNYNLTKSINLNIEPTFKYQLNTFENTSGDFKPYFIGLYSGIKYKF